ncbi:MAG: hypothetical protein LZF60_270251 [Nitrospira sp.]|nr:MAG: hypothetical protein LZF60_270251 [Nitrospira sp.]
MPLPRTGRRVHPKPESRQFWQLDQTIHPRFRVAAEWRALKTPANFVLGSKKSSTYPRGYASGFFSPAAALAAVLSTRVKKVEY